MQKRVLLVAALAAMLVLSSGAAFAADGDGGSGTVSAAVGVSSGVFGTRSVATVTPSIPLALIPGSAQMNGNVAIVIAENARTGTASWSVTGVLAANLSDGGTPAETIARDRLAMATTANPIIVSGGGEGAFGAGGTLEEARTVFSVSGQDPELNYTGTYSSSSSLTLTIPNAQKTGIYTGTLMVSLVQ